MIKAFVLFASVAQVSAQLTCVGTLSNLFDDWCNAICNHSPSFCLEAFCDCDDGLLPVPSQNLVCGPTPAWAAVVDDAFCQATCTHVPPVCPEDICQCTSGPVSDDAGTLTSLSDHTKSCCVNDPQFLFFSTPSAVMKTEVGTGNATICYSFQGGLIHGLAIDDDDNLYMADPLTSAIYRGSTNCNSSTLVLLTNFHSNQLIDHPVSLAFANGALYVAAQITLYQIRFTDTGNIFDILASDVANMTSSSAIASTDDGTGIYFVRNPSTISLYTPSTGVIVDYATLEDRVSEVLFDGFDDFELSQNLWDFSQSEDVRVLSGGTCMPDESARAHMIGSLRQLTTLPVIPSEGGSLEFSFAYGGLNGCGENPDNNEFLRLQFRPSNGNAPTTFGTFDYNFFPRGVIHNIKIDFDDLTFLVDGEAGAFTFFQPFHSGSTIDAINFANVTLTHRDATKREEPDVEGLAVNPCGVFFTSIASDRVYRCTDFNDGSSCEVYCNDAGLNADTCENVHDPVRIASGCCCDVFVSNLGSGEITRFDSASAVTEIDGLSFPTALVLHVPANGACLGTACSASPTPTSSASHSPTGTVSISSSVTATLSASPSVTPPISPSPSPTVV